jgi:ADP-dependent NAD(P)H-hydrate dehydratase / NAD(P)H-hydrate epimerase
LKVVTAGEMRAIEEEVVARGTTLTTLMERAGLAVANEVSQQQEGNILVLVGPGNNGGDGLIAARHLEDGGRHVAVYAYRRQNLEPYTGAWVNSESDRDLTRLADLVSESQVVVDAVLGTGQTRPPDEELTRILQCVNQKRASGNPAIAVDVPTGVSADTGAVPGEAFAATKTLCLAFLKCGSVVYPGAEYSGKTTVLDVRIPIDLANDVRRIFPEDPDIEERLPSRGENSNKGSSGNLLVVAGSGDYLGAPVLSSVAAYRAGAGLVNLALPSAILKTVASNVTEAIFTPLPEVDRRISVQALPVIQKGLEKARALLFGPGLGLSDDTVKVTQETLSFVSETGKPAVFDADGLNALSGLQNWWETKAKLVITPHPGEMSRLTGLSIQDIQSDRVSTAQRFATEWEVVVVLKGAGTIVASPDGEVSINGTGGPNLATAGTGDVLSGIIGGLLAQGVDTFDAAVAGVYLHGRAGDLVREDLGDVGTIASDLLRMIPKARLSLES